MLPEQRELERRLAALSGHPLLAVNTDPNGRLRLSKLPLEDIATLLRDETASLFLLAAADLNRTAIRAGTETPDALLVAPSLRRAFVVRSQLPASADFQAVVGLAVQRRTATLGRNANAATETLFRERIAFEGLPLRLRGAWTSGVLVDRRKPDGVFPDPETGRAPQLYLEIKKVNRVRDDIQKRLYEIAEASLEVKFLYGRLKLAGLQHTTLLDDSERDEARAELRRQVTAVRPTVVALLICRAEELEVARRYRPRIEAFIDRLFFADETDACLDFLRGIVERDTGSSP